MIDAESKSESPITDPPSPTAPTHSVNASSAAQGRLLAGKFHYSDQEKRLPQRTSNSHAKVHARSCTDVVFLIAFLSYWTGLLVLGGYAWTRGTNVEFAKYIRNGVDYRGNECLQGRYLYFPDFKNTPQFGICIAQCPRVDNQLITVALPTRNDTSSESKTLMRNVTFETYATHTWAYICAPANVPTEKTLIAQLEDTAGRFVGVLDNSWKVYGLSCLISAGSAFLYLVFLRLFGSFAVVLSAFGIEGILVYSSYRLVLASADPTLYPSDPFLAQSIQALSIITCCGAIIFLLLVMYMAQRLIVAGIFIRHASCVLAQLPTLLFVPFLTFGLLVGLFVWGIKITVSIFGSGSITWDIATVTAASPATVHIMTESFRVDKVLRWFFLYHLWGMYWTLHFILSLGELITTIAVSIWYFSENGKKASKKQLIPSSPVAYAVQSTLCKHLGTLVFSSAIGSLTRLSRSVYVKLQDRSELDANSSVECFTKCCCCCIWCFDSCLRYVRKEAVYITAIQGSGYFHSAKLAYALLSANLVRYGALDRIGHASVFMGKLIVCVTTCLAFWLYLDMSTPPILPLAVILVFSFSVAHAFMTIFETTIDALLICFTLDESINGGRGNAAYATGSLTESVNQHLRPKWQTVL